MLKLIVGMVSLSLISAVYSPPVIFVFMEAQHSECSIFFHETISKTITIKDFDKISKIVFVPYGSTQKIKDHPYPVFHCGDTKLGCYGNRIYSCALFFLKKEYFLYQYILKDRVHQSNGQLVWNRRDIIPNHNKNLSHGYSDGIQQCANGMMGDQLLKVVAGWTGNLDPSHTYLPWITVDGLHDIDKENEIKADIVQWACKNYKGDIKLDVCRSY